MPIFRAAAESFADRNKDGWKGADARANWICPLVRHAYPVIGDMPVNAIRRSQSDSKSWKRRKSASSARGRPGARRPTDHAAARPPHRRGDRLRHCPCRRRQESSPARQPSAADRAAETSDPVTNTQDRRATPHYRAPETKDVPRVYGELRVVLRERPVLGGAGSG